MTDFPGLPKIDGRILIGGELRATGFEKKQVFSTCHRGGEDVLLGTTPHVTQEVLSEAVAAASKAWAKGLGAWPMMRMEERIAAVVKFRDLMLAQRELVCRLLMWEIGKKLARRSR